MGVSNVQLLLGVNFLHFVSAGLVAPVLTQHICLNGGNHFILGLLGAALFVSNKISKSFMTCFNHGNKFSLQFCLFSSFITYLLLVFNYNLWIIFLNRCLYALTNQISLVSKEYVAKIQTGDTQMNSLNLLEVTEVAGIVLGAISGGYIFESNEDFRVIATIASLMTLLAILVVQNLDDDVIKIYRETPDLLELIASCCHKIGNLRGVVNADNWNRIFLVSVYYLTTCAYFSRFAFLLTSNFHIGTIIIGYSVAYQFMWKFFCDCAAPFLKDQVANKDTLFNYSLIICGLTLSGLYYAPNYETYLVLFIPMMVTNSLINSLLDEDVLEFANDGLEDIVDTITNLIHVFGPICFGILCQIYEAKAFQFLLMLPIVVNVFLVMEKRRSQCRGEDKAKAD